MRAKAAERTKSAERAESGVLARWRTPEVLRRSVGREFLPGVYRTCMRLAVGPLPCMLGDQLWAHVIEVEPSPKPGTRSIFFLSFFFYLFVTIRWWGVIASRWWKQIDREGGASSLSGKHHVDELFVT